MILACDQREHNISISTPQIASSEEIKGRNTNCLVDTHALVWISHVFLGIDNLHSIQPPVFGKSNTYSISQDHSIHRIYLVICDTETYENPPIFSKVLVSSKFVHYFSQKIRPLKFNPTPSKYISFINRDKSNDCTHFIDHAKSTPSIGLTEDNLGNTNYDNTTTSRQLLRKLVQQLGDSVIVDKYSDCGYSIIYPMEGQAPTSPASPTCSVGIQHEAGLEEYTVAFEFAKKHGYGFVEFVDVTDIPRTYKKKKGKRSSMMAQGDCMYSTSHHLENGPFSIKYRSKPNTIKHCNSARFCPSNNFTEMHEQREEKTDFDIVKKISDDIARLDIECDAATTVHKRTTHSNSRSKKRNVSENSYRKKINKKYGKRASDSTISDACLLNTNETSEGNSDDDEQNYNNGLDTEDVDYLGNDITFNTWDEFELTRPDTAKHKNPATTAWGRDLSYTNEGNIQCNDMQGGHEASGLVGQEQREFEVKRSEVTRHSLFKSFRKFNPFKSMISTLKIFKKTHTPYTLKEEPRSLKVEELHITRIDYDASGSGKEIDPQISPGRSDGDETEITVSLNSNVTRQKPLKETDNKKCKSSKCRPKPASLRNSYVKHVFKMCGNGRRFFSCTNLTNDSKEYKSTTSLDKYQDATSGDFAKRVLEVHSNKLQIPTSTTTANAHGDVVVSSAMKPGDVTISNCLGDQTLPFGFSRSVYGYNKLQEVGADVEQTEKEGLRSLNEPGKNNNKSETTVIKNNRIGHTSMDKSQLDHSSKSEYVYSNTPSTSKHANTEILNALSPILFEEEEEEEGDDDMNLIEKNCNNNAEESEHELNCSKSQTSSTKADVDTSRNAHNTQSPRSDLTGSNEHVECPLDNELKCLVNDQYATDNDTNFACSSNASDPLYNSDAVPYFNQNSSKIVQKGHRVSSGRYCTPSTNNPHRSYVLSSPRRPDVDISELYELEHATNDTDGRENAIVNYDQASGQSGFPHGGNRIDEMSLSCEDGFPPINMHQRNMVYCPTTENYWASARRYPQQDNLDCAETESQCCQGYPGSCEEHAMHVEAACDNSQNQGADNSLDIYRLVGSCVSQSENKLRERLENMYGSVNERLSSLETLVKKRFDKTLSLIGNLKKQNKAKYRNDIDEDSEWTSRSIHLNTEATRSNGPDMVSVKNLGNLKQSETNGTHERHNTFPSIAFTEVTPNNNHTDPSVLPEKLNDDADNILSDLENSESKQKLNDETDPKTLNKKQYAKSKKYPAKKKQSARHKPKYSKYSKKIPTQPSSTRKQKKMTQIIYRINSRKPMKMGMPKMTTFSNSSNASYLQRQHSRKCRLRHRLTGESSCALCMMPSRKLGQNNSKGKVQWRKSSLSKRHKQRRHSRALRSRLVNVAQRTKRRNRITVKRKRKKSNKKRQRNKQSKRATRSRKYLDKSNSSAVIDSPHNDTGANLSQHQEPEPEQKRGIQKQRNVPCPQRRRKRKCTELQGHLVKKNRANSKSQKKSKSKVPSKNLKNLTQIHDSRIVKRTRRTEQPCKGTRRNFNSNSKQRKKTKVRKMVGWSKDVIKKDGTRRRYPQSTHPRVARMHHRVKRRPSKKSQIKVSKVIKSGREINKKKMHRPLKKNKSMVKKVASMKRSLSHASHNTVIKREVMDEFNRLLSKCSHQRARNLHNILLPRKRKLSSPCPETFTSLMSNASQANCRTSSCTEENNNKSVVVSNMDVLNRTSRQCNSMQIPGKHSFVRTGLLRHVDSLSLIRKELGCKNNSKNSCEVIGLSCKPVQTRCRVCSNPATKIVTSERPCSSTQVDERVNAFPQFKLKQYHDKRTKTNHKLICYESKDLCELVSNRNGSGKIGVVKWSQSIESDITYVVKTPLVNEDIETKGLDTPTHISNREIISPMSTPPHCAIRPVLSVNTNTYDQPGYSWSEPKCVDLSDFTRTAYENISQQSDGDPRENAILSVLENPAADHTVEEDALLESVLEQGDASVHSSDLRQETMDDDTSQPKTKSAKSSTICPEDELENCDSEREYSSVDSEQDADSTSEMTSNNNIQVNFVTSCDSGVNAHSSSIFDGKFPTLVLRLRPIDSSSANLTDNKQPSTEIVNQSQTVAKNDQCNSLKFLSPNDTQFCSEKLDMADADVEEFIQISDSSSREIGQGNNISLAPMCDSSNQNSSQPTSTFDPQYASTTQQQSPSLCHQITIPTGHTDSPHFGVNAPMADDSTTGKSDDQNDNVNEISRSSQHIENVGCSSNKVLSSSIEFELPNKSEKFVTFRCDEQLNELQSSQRIELSPFNGVSVDNQTMISVNNNKIIDTSSSVDVHTSSGNDDSDESKLSISDLKRDSKNDILSSSKLKNIDQIDNSGSDDDVSNTKCTVTRQPYLEVRTPGLSTKWTISSTLPNAHSTHQNDDSKQSQKSATQQTFSADPGPSNTGRHNWPENENMTDSADSKNSIHEANLASQFERHSRQLDNEYSGFCSDPEEPSSTSSGTNNNNVTDNSMHLQSENHQDGSDSPIRANDGTVSPVKICRYLPYDKYDCHCCCTPVKSMTTLFSQKTTLVQGLGLLELSEVEQGSGQEGRCEHDEASRKDSLHAGGVFANPRKRSMSTDSDGDRNVHSAKCRKKEGPLSQARRLMIHSRRARWQQLREMKFNRLGNAVKKKGNISKLTIAPPKPLHLPSSDADSESSL